MTPPCTHMRQFKEMLRTAKSLPAGNWSKPSEVLALKWFYMSFDKNDCNKFITAGKNLRPRPSSLPLSFLKPSSTRTKNNGTLKRMELKPIKKHSHLKLKSKLCNKICKGEDKHCTYQAKCELASRNAATLMTALMSDIGTLIAIGIAIVPMTTNVERQSALASSALAIATGRMTVTTISLKS
jgi:hypothetical protein